MCHVINNALASVPRTDRRSLLKMLGAGAAGAAVAATAGPFTAAPAAASGRRSRTSVVLLGTAGGPAYVGGARHGVSTAIVFDGRAYVVDLGMGSFTRLVESGLGPDNGLAASLTPVRGLFFTHLHSDHITDWPAMYATGSMNASGRPANPPVNVFGPGRRDTMTRVFPPTRPEPEVINPENPTAGTEDMTSYLRQAFSADFNDRRRDSNFPDPKGLFNVQDIDLTGVWSVDPGGVPPRLARPLEIWEDDAVRVTATLVDHRPTAPAFAFRFDTPDGSVVVSGDTAVSENLIDLATDADVLVHEVIDPLFIDKLTASLPPETAGPVREHLLASHTTIEQVGRDVAEPAGAKTLVLSHLVPAANPTSRWREAQRGYSGHLVVGKDLMTLPVGA